MSTRTILDNRFEIADLERDLLGRGGMGDVYRSSDLEARARDRAGRVGVIRV